MAARRFRIYPKRKNEEKKKMIQKKTEQNKKRTKQIERYTTERKQRADGQNR